MFCSWIMSLLFFCSFVCPPSRSLALIFPVDCKFPKSPSAVLVLCINESTCETYSTSTHSVWSVKLNFIPEGSQWRFYIPHRDKHMFILSPSLHDNIIKRTEQRYHRFQEIETYRDVGQSPLFSHQVRSLKQSFSSPQLRRSAVRGKGSRMQKRKNVKMFLP